jgi:hypothetical protein
MSHFILVTLRPLIAAAGMQRRWPLRNVLVAAVVDAPPVALLGLMRSMAHFGPNSLLTRRGYALPIPMTSHPLHNLIRPMRNHGTAHIRRKATGQPGLIKRTVLVEAGRAFQAGEIHTADRL